MLCFIQHKPSVFICLILIILFRRSFAIPSCGVGYLSVSVQRHNCWFRFREENGASHQNKLSVKPMHYFLPGWECTRESNIFFAKRATFMISQARARWVWLQYPFKSIEVRITICPWWEYWCSGYFELFHDFFIYVLLKQNKILDLKIHVDLRK